MTKHIILILLILSISPYESAAQQDYAPDYVQGATMLATISNGSGFFADAGQFILKAATAGNTYTIFGGPGIDGTVGTYSYSKLSPTSAQLVLNDSALGMAVSQVITFTGPTTGSYMISNSYGSQSGTFTFTVPMSTIPSDWKFDAFYPWVWNPVNGWLYYFPNSAGLWIYHQSAGQWESVE